VAQARAVTRDGNMIARSMFWFIYPLSNFTFLPPTTMKPRDYCCCAIPVVNVGIYSTLAEQFVLGILAGTLSVATPDSNIPPLLPRFMTEQSLYSCRRCNSFVCSLDFCYHLLCRCFDSNIWLHWRCPGLHSSTYTSPVTHHFTGKTRNV
jgi:hypothetical protein